MNRRNFLGGTVAAAGATISKHWLVRLLPETDLNGPSRQQPRPVSAGEVLIEDDFSSFPVGPLTHPIGQLNGAIQEVHFPENRGVPLGPWANSITHMDAWVISDEDGRAYIEQHLVNELAYITNPILITGDEGWTDYTLSVGIAVRPVEL